MKRTSIKDIAQAVGVSIATVSLVLNDKGKNGRVSEKMSKKIRLVAKEMNYHPNRLARNLQSGSTQTISLLVADIVNPFFGALAYHIQKELAQAGYAVIITNTDEDSEQMERMINLMRSRQVDGFIIVPAEHGEKSIQHLVDDKIPMVLIDRYYPEVQTNNVLIDNYDASYQATKYLIEKRCKHIALLIYDNYQPHMQDRRTGYTEALKEAGLFDKTLIKEVKHENISENIQQAVASLISEKNIDGILLASNTIAVNGLKQLIRQKVRIPEDIQIVCFDKNDILDVMPVSIPYIQQPIQSIAKMASRLLLEQLNNGSGSTNASSYRLPSELIV